jgi:hypothetical protein
MALELVLLFRLLSGRAVLVQDAWRCHPAGYEMKRAKRSGSPQAELQEYLAPCGAAFAWEH